MKTVMSLCVCAAAVAVSLALAAGCGWSHVDGTTGATKHKHAAVKLPPASDTYTVIGEVDGLNNFVVKYSEKLYRGGYIKNEKGIGALKKWGVGTIITVTPTDEERQLAKDAGLKLVELPIKKAEPISAETIEAFLSAVKAEPKVVYVHCIGGTHRAAALSACYRIKAEGWTYDKAAIEYDRLGGDLDTDAKMIGSLRPAGK